MMKHKLNPSPLALAAIFAASAIPFTPALAQEVQTDSPTAVAAPAPDPDPPAAAAAIAAEPVIAPARQALAPDAPAAQTAATVAKRRLAGPVPAAVREARAKLAPVAAAPAAKPVTTLPATTASPAPPVVFAPETTFAEPAPLPAPPADDSPFVPLALGSVVLGGVLLFGAAAGSALIGRRRRKEPADDEALDDGPNTRAAKPEPAPMPVAETVIPAPLFAATASDAHEWQERVILPAGPLPTGAAREALLARMVAAPPDKDNPFRSAIRRRKRARIVLGAHEARLREAATEPFDFRTFKPFSQTEAAEAGVHYDMPFEKETLN
jgi:hypothetical protein